METEKPQAYTFASEDNSIASFFYKHCINPCCYFQFSIEKSEYIYNANSSPYRAKNSHKLRYVHDLFETDLLYEMLLIIKRKSL